MTAGLMECPVDEQGWAVRESEAMDAKTRMNHTWRRLLEVIGENPEKTISDFIEYSKSSNISRFSLLNRFFPR